MTERKKEAKKQQERLAEYAHDAWSHWMNYLFSVSTKHEDGTVVIPKYYVDRWEKQMSTKYDDLPYEEQWSDLAEAKKITDIILGRWI